MPNEFADQLATIRTFTQLREQEARLKQYEQLRAALRSFLATLRQASEAYQVLAQSQGRELRDGTMAPWEAPIAAAPTDFECLIDGVRRGNESALSTLRRHLYGSPPAWMTLVQAAAEFEGLLLTDPAGALPLLLQLATQNNTTRFDRRLIPQVLSFAEYELTRLHLAHVQRLARDCPRKLTAQLWGPCRDDARREHEQAKKSCRRIVARVPEKS